MKILPSVSIVVPAYNEENYIGRCLEAVLAQDYEGSKEVIVINNASEDRTEEIVRSFPGVKVIYELRKGIARARQTGFETAQGEIIFSTDADSCVSRDWVSKIIFSFLEDAKLQGVNGPGCFYDTELFEKIYTPYQNFVSFYALRGGNVCYGYNFAVKKEAFYAIGGFNVGVGNLGDDVDLWRRLRKHGKIKFDPKVVVPVSYRRYKSKGVIKTALRAFIIYISINFFNLPPSWFFK